MCNYYYVRGEDDVIYCILVVNGFCMFNFGNNFCIIFCIVCQVMGIVQIFVIVWEGDSQVIYVN